jgi:hypothetical protein
VELGSWFCGHGRRIAKARIARRTPINGLETANQKEMSQPESWVVGFIFMLFSQASEGRHFRRFEVLLRLFFRGGDLALAG